MASDYPAHRRDSLDLPAGHRREDRAATPARRCSLAAPQTTGPPLRTNALLAPLGAGEPRVREERSSPLPAQPRSPPAPHVPRAPPRPRGGVALLKLALLAFSAVGLASGLALLGAGLWAELWLRGFLLLSAQRFPRAPAALLAAGAAVLLWGALGCFAAATERRCLLRAFGLFQAAVLAGGLAAGLSGLFYRRDIAEGFRRGLREALRFYPEPEERAEALDALQRALRCCGEDSYRDWLASTWAAEQQLQAGGAAGNSSVPASCCQTRRGCRHSPLPPDPDPPTGIHLEGCFRRLHRFVSDNLFYMATAALALALTQAVGILLACLLAARIRAPAPGGA